MKLINKLFPKKNKCDSSLIKELKKIAFLKGLSSHELIQFANLVHERKFKENEIIFKENYPHAVLYMLIEGEVEIFINRNEGSHKIAILKPYNAFGEVGLFIDTDRTASAKCTVGTTLLAISKQDFIQYIDQYPKSGVKIMYNFGKTLSTSLINMNKKVTNEDQES